MIYVYSTFQLLPFTKQLFNISIDRRLILLNVKENETQYKNYKELQDKDKIVQYRWRIFPGS